MKLDAVDYLKKPFNVDEFREVLDARDAQEGPRAHARGAAPQGHRRHDPEPAQGEGPHAQADVPPHRPQRLAALADRARRIEPVDLALYKIATRARHAHPGPVRRVLSQEPSSRRSRLLSWRVEAAARAGASRATLRAQMRPPFLRACSLLAFVGCAVFALRTHEARAAWPPAPGADMKDPANWPNDATTGAGTTGRSSRRARRPIPRWRADVKLGASGMSIDKAWALHDRSRRRAHRGPRLRHRVGEHGPRQQGRAQCRRAEGREAPAERERRGLRRHRRASPATTATATASSRSRLPRRPAHLAGGHRREVLQRRRAHDDRPGPHQGDLNRNCILDPGDLIAMFSDGIDDDAQRLRRRHRGLGLLQERQRSLRRHALRPRHRRGQRLTPPRPTTATATPGVCPQCRFIPLRVGESFITDVERLRARPSSTRPTTARRSCRRRSARSTAPRSRRRRSTTRTRRARSSSRAWPTRTRATTTCPRRRTTRCRCTRSATTATAPPLDDVPRVRPVLELRRRDLLSASGTRAARARRRAQPRASPGLVYSMALRSQGRPAAHRRRGPCSSSSRAPTTSTSPSRSERRRRRSTLAAGLRSALRLRPHERQRARCSAIKDGQDPARGRHRARRLVRASTRIADTGRSRSWAPSRARARRPTTYVVEWAPGVQPDDGDFKPHRRAREHPVERQR